MKRRGIRIIEIATVCAVLGILASLAIPSLMQMQARSRVDQLLASARACREELPHWLSGTLPNRQAEGRDSVESTPHREGASSDARKTLECYARIYNERSQAVALPGQAPIVVVEPTGTPPVFCKRDGRIHIIPLAGPDSGGIAATVVVTDENRFGGPDSDGILAVYNVQTGAP